VERGKKRIQLLVHSSLSETIKGSMKSQVNFFIDPFAEK
jgi:hypothetical protein